MLDEVHSSLRYLYPAKMFSVRGCLLFVALRLAVFWEETAFCPTRYLIPLHPGRAPMKQSFSDLAPADHRRYSDIAWAHRQQQLRAEPRD